VYVFTAVFVPLLSEKNIVGRVTAREGTSSCFTSNYLSTLLHLCVCAVLCVCLSRLPQRQRSVYCQCMCVQITTPTTAAAAAAAAAAAVVCVLLRMLALLLSATEHLLASMPLVVLLILCINSCSAPACTLYHVAADAAANCIVYTNPDL
jgi:hypothetical protein